MHKAPEIETPSEADGSKPRPFNVEAAAAALLKVIGPNDPFPDQDTLKVYPCKFPK